MHHKYHFLFFLLCMLTPCLMATALDNPARLRAGAAENPPKCIIYGFAEHQVLAEVENAVQSEVAYESFEDITVPTGGWSYSITAVQSAGGNRSITGLKFYNLNNGALFKLIDNPPGKNMILSYWSRSGPQNVGSYISMQTGRSVTIDGYTWTFYEYLLNNPSVVGISGAGIIDEVRYYPQDATMTSFTYEPLVGVRTKCDINNNITYYDYDHFKRISVIRDQYFRVIKKYCYGEAGQQQDCSGLLFASEERSGIYTRTDCPPGYQPGSVTYTVPVRAYVSSVDQSTANDMAQTDLTTNGPKYANINGACNFIYYNAPLAGYYYSQVCSGVPQPIWVSVPDGMFSSIISQQAANDQAAAYAQSYANTNGTCLTDFTLYCDNQFTSGTIYITLTNTSTWEQYYYEVYWAGYNSLGTLPAGNYDIEITDYTVLYKNYQVCGYYESGYQANFYNVPLSNSCGTIQIY